MLNLEELEPRCVLSGDIPPAEAILVNEQIGPGFVQYTYWLQGQIWVTDTRLEELHPQQAKDSPLDLLKPPVQAAMLDMPTAEQDAMLAIFLAEMEQGQDVVSMQMISVTGGMSWQLATVVTYEPLSVAGQEAEIVDLGNGYFTKQWEDEEGEWFAWSDDLEQWSIETI